MHILPLVSIALRPVAYVLRTDQFGSPIILHYMHFLTQLPFVSMVTIQEKKEAEVIFDISAASFILLPILLAFSHTAYILN